MKLLVGVDSEGHCRSALSLLARLKLSNPDLTLLYADQHEQVWFAQASREFNVIETYDAGSRTWKSRLAIRVVSTHYLYIGSRGRSDYDDHPLK